MILTHHRTIYCGVSPAKTLLMGAKRRNNFELCGHNRIMDKKTAGCEPPHPEKNPKYPGPLTPEGLTSVFTGCGDYETREVMPGLLPGFGRVTLCWLDGLVDGTAVSEDVLRPLTDLGRTISAHSPEQLMEILERGAAYSYTVRRRDTLDGVVSDLVNGFCVLLFATGAALSFETRTRLSRSVGEPSIEKAIKGGKDAFVELLRTNTSLVRRKLRTPELKVTQTVVGRLSGTGVALLYIEGVARQEIVSEAQRRIGDIDIDGLLAAGDLEEYIVDSPNSPLPQLLHTERPDTFAIHLLDGRVGILVDGLPVGFLLPADLAAFLRVPEDSAMHFSVASLLTLLRWIALGLSLLLPAAFVAISMYHQEMLPVKLLLSMTAAKQNVPFSVATEVVAMLLAFELLQEAGLRLPDPVGQTASIIGALIVGQSAVEARVVSPIAVIVVALSGISGYTMPSQDFGSAIRLARLLLVAVAAALGLYGVITAFALLVWYTAGLESFGQAYTAPFTGSDAGALARVLLKRPNRANKLRAAHLAGRNRRRQR